jgi:RNA polymerase sigma factor (sigma-70 family)
MTHPHPSSTNLSIIGNSLLNPLDIESGERFLAKYKPLIFKVITKQGIKGPDADDLVQETLHRILAGFPKFYRRRPGSFRIWLRKITRSIIVDWFRSRKRHHLAPISKIEEIVSKSIVREFDLEIYEMAIRKVRLEISPKHWDIFEMFRLKGAPIQKVSEKFGIGLEGIYKVNQRVFYRLQQLVKEIMCGELA